jgi:hypothetical protein
MVINHQSPATFVPVNPADNWLHLFLGLGMIALGRVLALQPDKTRTAP